MRLVALLRRPVLCFSLLSLSAHWTLNAAPDPAEKIGKEIENLKKIPCGGVAVLAARDGKIIYQGGVGSADEEKKIPVTADTVFRIGSVTKQFTAAALLRLMDEGKLSLTDPLSKFFPKFPRAEKITVEQLLTHTSGIHSYTDNPYFLLKVIKPTEPEKLIAAIQEDKPDFDPGAGFHYNNSAYFIAGEIAAKVSGKSFADYLRTAFFEPLGMKHTGIYLNAKPPEKAALGYSWVDGKSKPSLEWDMSWAGGAGALYSTVGDLFLWNEALFGGKVLKPETFKRMCTPVKLPDGVEGWNYGYGLVMSDVRTLPAISHSGGLDGWSSDLLRLPEQRCTVVVLANSMPGPPGFAATALTRSLAEALAAEEIAKVPPLVEDKTVDPKIYSAFVGRYDYTQSVLTVTTEDNKLYAQLTDQPRYEIFPKSATEYFWKVADARVVFLRNEKGAVTAAQHTQGGFTFKADRVADPEKKPTTEQLDAIVGDYKYADGVTLKVSRQGENLYAELTGQPRFPIFAKSESLFEWHVVKASIEFEKNKEGKIYRARHRQNGMTNWVPKIGVNGSAKKE